MEAFWAGTSYLLTSAIFQPVIASISSLFGRQQLLIISLIFFTVGTVLCAVSNDFTMLLTGRCIQGVGGGGIITLTQVIFCDIVPLRQRPKYFALVLGSWSIGSILGPVIGGVLVQKTSWRWCFHINYPFCGIGFVVAILFVRLNAVAELTIAQKLKRTDWIGAFLFVGGMTSFLVGLSWGGIQHPWKSAATLGPVIMGLVGIVVFFCWQVYKKENTLLPMSIFYNFSAIAAFYSALINGLIVSHLGFISVHRANDIAFHFSLLPTLLRDECAGLFFHRGRHRPLSCRLPSDTRLYRGVGIDLAARTIPLGNLGWLGSHYPGLWIATSLRHTHEESCCCDSPGHLWCRHRYGLDERQRRYPGYLEARGLCDGCKYVRLLPQSGNAAWCCCKFPTWYMSFETVILMLL